MKKIIVLFVILSWTLLADGIGEFSSNLSVENDSLYLKNSLGLKNVLIDYEKGINYENENVRIILRNNHLQELKEDLYYTVKYELELDRNFAVQDNDLLRVSSEFKLAKYINDNFFINGFLESTFLNYTNISFDENIYLKPKIQFRFLQTNLDINLNSGIRYFTSGNRKDYELELFLSKEFFSRWVFQLGNYAMQTNIGSKDVVAVDMADIFNENVDKTYFYLSYNAINDSDCILKLYTKGDYIVYFESEDYESEIYTGLSFSKELGVILDSVEISGEYGYNYNEYTSSISLKKYF